MCEDWARICLVDAGSLNRDEEVDGLFSFCFADILCVEKKWVPQGNAVGLLGYSDLNFYLVLEIDS